ncbi:cytochrome P450-like protein [Cellulomonas flavigena DSM 20109]|uniref:Cytochrome P450-like protein n=1 Tax=Cellulomonas flavigena (strain ATCC 482 / DSM 20109 / BCRC 11376 / JCM 18109 / NBRC 3775 / NCIMB 8073 / NRS 134) TaxID=446466 RepID=D5UG03_CELFN|nr:cytochrome P450 [Cellulomonas flavigena]ADG75026.1 cytochrome P450-like protein [Cellulomonas flavigena DSM 20109]
MSGAVLAVAAGALVAAAVWTLPRWLPPTVVRLRERVFAAVNGTEGVSVPGPLVGAEHFEDVYAHPAADGRSAGAGLSDLFWYWLAPGAHMHQEHLEPGERYRTVARTTRQVLAVRHARSDELATAAVRRALDALPADRPSHVRLRDLLMPVWAEVYHELVFDEPCPPAARALVVGNADDVVTALKCTGLRHMDRRARLTRYLRARVEDGTCPVVLPPPFTAQETAWYLQGAFFNTAVVQMSEAAAHVLLCAGAYPPARSLVDDDDALDRVVDETLRVHPLFGVAHRITSAPIEVGDVTLPSGSVLLFNYLAYQRTGAAGDDVFDPERWRTLRHHDAHFVPFGVTANRACPARGSAPVMLRAVLREVLRRYDVTPTGAHTRSMPNRGPAFLTPVGAPSPSRARVAALRLGDRWSDVGRSLTQLALGTVMVLEARRLKPCSTYFSEARA